MKKILRIVYLPLCVLLLVCTINRIVFAAETQTESLPDLDKTGSVIITMRDTDSGETVSGGSVLLYPVADPVEVNGDFSYEFTESFSDSGFALEDIATEKLAADLADYVERNHIKGTARDVKEDGTVFFDDLKTGLYLVTQKSPSEGYEAIRPFLVSVPVQSEDGSWIYEVDASPKVELKTSSGSNPSKPDDPNNPNGKDHSSGITKLPQTGQLNWPVPVLAVGGLLLFSLGWMLNNNAKRSNRYER